MQAMYIRVKRNKTTYFIQCDATEKILDIKQKLHDLIDQPINDQRLILVSTGEVLDDSKTLADQKVFGLPFCVLYNKTKFTWSYDLWDIYSEPEYSLFIGCWNVG